MGRGVRRLTRQGIYISKLEFDTLKKKVPYLASIKHLSKEEIAVFKKLEQGIKNPNIMRRKDYGVKENLSGDIWLTPLNAKLLLAWKEAALEGKVSRQGGRLGSVSRTVVIKKWEKLFKEKITISRIHSLAQQLKQVRNIDLAQANVSIPEIKKEGNKLISLKRGRPYYLSEKDSQFIKLRLIDKLSYEKIAKKLGISTSNAQKKAKSLKEIGYNV